MKSKLVIDHITQWLKEYSDRSGTSGFVIGISGGIDSAVTSALCAATGKKTLVVEIPIYQAPSQVNRAQEHIAWLKKKYGLIGEERIELTAAFDAFQNAIPHATDDYAYSLSLANTRARLRMTTLYYLAGIHNLLVAGTGNKVEDFGIGFFTKYGDGGVDLSPIADLKKTEVYALATELGIVSSILQAAPTDGLFGDNRTDEDQIGASYPELEWAMDFIETKRSADPNWKIEDATDVTVRQKEVLSIYWKRNRANRHKVQPIPVCIIPPELK